MRYEETEAIAQTTGSGFEPKIQESKSCVLPITPTCIAAPQILKGGSFLRWNAGQFYQNLCIIPSLYLLLT